MSDVEQIAEIYVLLVDDEVNVLNSLRRLLVRIKNIKIATATSGEEGLRQLDGLENVGVIITDQRMPNMSGAVFLEHAIVKAPDAIRIVMTGYADTSAAIDAINKGNVWKYLPKPWNDPEVLGSVQEGVDRYRMLQENRQLNALVQKQKEELEEWNNNLKSRVLQQTTAIRKKSEEVQAALERVREIDDLARGVVSLLCGLVELRGARTLTHSQNVAQLAESAAKEMGMDADAVETVRIAALLHDIGEIGISERLLLTAPEAMKPSEFREYCQHPVNAQILLDNVEGLRGVARLIRHHHENFDGTGFPDKLSGEEIPLGSRIIAYADQLDRGALTCVGDIAEQALDRAQLLIGHTLDPALQKVFKKVARYCYHTKASTDTKKYVEKRLTIDELRPGMILARNLFDISGRTVFSKGTVLDAVKIASVRGRYGVDHDDSVYVNVDTSV